MTAGFCLLGVGWRCNAFQAYIMLVQNCMKTAAQTQLFALDGDK
jgi:hypothetical protein